MYELTVRTTFAAAHAIVMSGERETLHGHNWDVTAVIRSPEVDGDGLVCDFHAAHGALVKIVEPFHNNTLNSVKPFDTVNPTAEFVARHIARSLSDALAPTLSPRGAKVHSVGVTESPGCCAWYYP
jgi:6-pyruvoyltetrahydropterin/6-carboxytetrahydropterin synthase